MQAEYDGTTGNTVRTSEVRVTSLFQRIRTSTLAVNGPDLMVEILDYHSGMNHTRTVLDPLKVLCTVYI